MHTIGKPFIPEKGIKTKKIVTVDFEIPGGATPIQATLDFKYLKYGCVEYIFDKEEQKLCSGQIHSRGKNC